MDGFQPSLRARSLDLLFVREVLVVAGAPGDCRLGQEPQGRRTATLLILVVAGTCVRRRVGQLLAVCRLLFGVVVHQLSMQHGRSQVCAVKITIAIRHDFSKKLPDLRFGVSHMIKRN